MFVTDKYVGINSMAFDHDDAPAFFHCFVNEKQALRSGAFIGYVVFPDKDEVAPAFASEDCYVEKINVTNTTGLYPRHQGKNDEIVFAIEIPSKTELYKLVNLKPLAKAVALGEVDMKNEEQFITYYYSPSDTILFVDYDEHHEEICSVEFKNGLREYDQSSFFWRHRLLEWCVDLDEIDSAFVKFGQPFAKVAPTNYVYKLREKSKSEIEKVEKYSEMEKISIKIKESKVELEELILMKNDCLKK